MLITINTDASFFDIQKIGSYAIWITTDAGRMRKVGVFKDRVNSPNEAEFKAILNALHILVNNGISPIHKIIINTDSLHTINLINKPENEQAKSKWGAELAKKYRRFLYDNSLTGRIELRHVKAHVHTNTARNWVNEWCDQQAKKILKEYVGKLRN